MRSSKHGHAPRGSAMTGESLRAHGNDDGGEGSWTRPTKPPTAFALPLSQCGIDSCGNVHCVCCVALGQVHVVLVNRDEFLSRPTAPAHWWPSAPNVLCE